jgi:hypothetical protein
MMTYLPSVRQLLRRGSRSNPLSQHINRVAGHPNVDLAELQLQPILQVEKKLPVFRDILDVNEDTNQFVVINLALMMPLALNCLGFARGCAELPPQFDEGSATKPGGTARR